MKTRKPDNKYHLLITIPFHPLDWAMIPFVIIGKKNHHLVFSIGWLFIYITIGRNIRELGIKVSEQSLLKDEMNDERYNPDMEKTEGIITEFPEYLIYPGMTFTGKHFTGRVEVLSIHPDTNILRVKCTKKYCHKYGVQYSQWYEDWDLSVTRIGFDQGEYFFSIFEGYPETENKSNTKKS